MKDNQQIIKTIIGQLNGIDKMITEERDCLDILEQMKAVKSMTERLINKHVEIELMKRVRHNRGKKKDYCHTLLKEIVKNN